MTDTTERATVKSGQRVLTGWRQKVDTVYAYLSALFFAGVLVQVFLAGVGVFGINALKVANASSFNAHRAWGFVLMLTSLVLLILALVAWQSKRTTISAFVLALLTVIAQNVLAAPRRQRQMVRRTARPRRHADPAALALDRHAGMAARAYPLAAGPHQAAGSHQAALTSRKPGDGFGSAVRRPLSTRPTSSAAPRTVIQLISTCRPEESAASTEPPVG